MEGTSIHIKNLRVAFFWLVGFGFVLNFFFVCVKYNIKKKIVDSAEMPPYANAQALRNDLSRQFHKAIQLLCYHGAIVDQCVCERINDLFGSFQSLHDLKTQAISKGNTENLDEICPAWRYRAKKFCLLRGHPTAIKIMDQEFGDITKKCFSSIRCLDTVFLFFFFCFSFFFWILFFF